MKFSGLDDWVAVFRGGSVRDSNGEIHDGDELIKKAVETFNPEEHEPPVVVGHPKESMPAYGWVAALKQVGNTLYAKFKDVQPAFEEAVRQKLYKKRSCSFYPDGRLRHVGFLGAVPPAIKGLPDVAFNDYEKPYIFTEKGGRQMEITFKDFFDFFKFWQKESAVTLGAPGADGEKEDGGMQFTEADIEAAKQEAAKAAKKQAEADFAEKQKSARADAEKKTNREFFDRLVKEGKALPAWKDQGIMDFMDELVHGGEIAFGEKPVSAAAWFRGFLSGLPKIIDFGEKAGGYDEAAPADKLDQLIKTKMNSGNLNYSEAFQAVMEEQPELAGEYASELERG